MVSLSFSSFAAFQWSLCKNVGKDKVCWINYPPSPSYDSSILNSLRISFFFSSRVWKNSGFCQHPIWRCKVYSYVSVRLSYRLYLCYYYNISLRNRSYKQYFLSNHMFFPLFPCLAVLDIINWSFLYSQYLSPNIPICPVCFCYTFMYLLHL